MKPTAPTPPTKVIDINTVLEPGKAVEGVSLSTLCEVTCAMHLASYVKSPLEDRGGLMLVGPPGALKTTALLYLDKHYTNALSYSMLNTTTLSKIRGDLISGTVRSIVLPDIQSIYAGDPRTCERLEQTLMQLAAEGSLGASVEDTRFRRFVSRATIFGAMPQAFFERRAPEWDESGFLRRFVWFFYRLKDSEVLIRAIVRWERARLNNKLVVPQIPADGDIQNLVSNAEREELSKMLKYQPGPHEVQLLMLSRTLAVLRWHYQRIGVLWDPMDTMREFSRGLQRQAAELIV